MEIYSDLITIQCSSLIQFLGPTYFQYNNVIQPICFKSQVLNRLTGIQGLK